MIAPGALKLAFCVDTNDPFNGIVPDTPADKSICVSFTVCNLSTF